MRLDKNDYKRGNKTVLFSSLAGNILQGLHFYFMLEFRAATIVTGGKKIELLQLHSSTHGCSLVWKMSHQEKIFLLCKRH